MHACARSDTCAPADRRTADDHCRAVDLSALEHECLRRHMPRPGRNPKHEIGGAAHEVPGSAEVEPVGVVDHAADQSTLGEERREGLTLDRYGAPNGNGVDGRPAKDVATGIDLVRDDLRGRRRLLAEGQHAPVLICRDQSIRGGIRDAHEVQGGEGARAHVLLHQTRVVHTTQHIAVEHHDGIVGAAHQVRGRMSDGSARAQGLILDGVGNLHTEMTSVAELFGENLRAVRRAEHDALDSSRPRALDLVHRHRNSCDRQHRLGRAQGQRPESSALAPDEEDRLAHAVIPSHAAGRLPERTGQTWRRGPARWPGPFASG